ncbi:kelch-like protein 9 [Paralichthys olivaceus]|uniref:kelch-like protein 9 n=1 Tax=Paralichthys olivaceus TaxID=8255 RepID=UPI00097E1266|nr:PREDICTED: kelch-like protein 5 [Paralichthys olivaceus]
MAEANPHLEEESDEWKNVNGGKRRRTLRERLSRWVKLEVHEEEEDWEETEYSEEKEENEAGGTEKEEEGSEQEGEGEKKVMVNDVLGKEEEEENEGERDVEENKQVDVKEEREVTKAEEQENIGEVRDDEGDSEDKGKKEVKEEEKEEEKKEVTQAEMVGIENGREDEEMVEREGGLMEAERLEEEGEMEEAIEPDVKKEVEEDGEETEEEQIQEKDYDSRTEEERVQQNQECATKQNEENFSDSVESDEDSLRMGSEDEGYNSERLNNEKRAVEKQCTDPKEAEDRILGVWNEEEDECEKLTNEEDSFTGSGGEFQEDLEKLLLEEEEDSSDEEEAELISYKDMESNDEDVGKVYCKDDYPTDLFCTLTEFRDSSLLTDLNLSTEAGKSFQVHSPVLAAVSSLVRESLSKRNTVNDQIEDDKKWSMCLGPEVDAVGLEAVVEFAYSGFISRLDTVDQIKGAAQTLGVPRLMDLCNKEESPTTAGCKKEEKISAAEERKISLQSIKQLWVDRVGCDVTLEGIGESLQVHRVILAAGSDYFRGMFTSGMRESHQHSVTLPFLLASELKLLVGCSYSGALPLSWRCVFEITSTALQLQYQPALSLSLNFLQAEINPLSCLDVASFAEAYEMEQLLETANDFVLRQFQKVACTLKFKDLPAKQLLKYLNSHSLCVPSELVVFKAVVAWIQAKPKKRLKLAKVLMKTIHFPLMTFKEFKEVQSFNIWSDHSLAELYEAVFEDFCSNETEPLSQFRIYLPKESLVLIGGEQISEDLTTRSISRELWFGNSLRNHTGIKKAMEWRRLEEMPEPARFSHEVAVLKGQLYVFGGKKYYGNGDTLNSVYRYDPYQNGWESLADMQQKRCLFSVVELDGQLYSIGGHCDVEYIESVERYCPTANSWSFTRPLDLPLSGHVAKVLQGQILVSGGSNSDYGCLSSLFRYNPETGSTYLANMTKPRAKHCMETLGDHLYVAGGITSAEPVNIVDMLSCEVYNLQTDTWTAFASLMVPHVGAGSAVLEGKFYVLGGYSHEDYTDTNIVHRYDPTTQRWENMGKMPGPNNDVGVSLLCLPQDLRL